MARTITDIDDAQIAQCIHALLAARQPGSSICPSDAARVLYKDNKGTAQDWRGLMPQVREVAYQLAVQKRLVITQGENTINPTTPAKGAIRLRLIKDE